MEGSFFCPEQRQGSNLLHLPSCCVSQLQAEFRLTFPLRSLKGRSGTAHNTTLPISCSRSQILHCLSSSSRNMAACLESCSSWARLQLWYPPPPSGARGNLQLQEVPAAQGLDGYSSAWEACLGGDASAGRLQCFRLCFCLSPAAAVYGHHFLSGGHSLLKTENKTQKRQKKSPLRRRRFFRKPSRWGPQAAGWASTAPSWDRRGCGPATGSARCPAPAPALPCPARARRPLPRGRCPAPPRSSRESWCPPALASAPEWRVPAGALCSGKLGPEMKGPTRCNGNGCATPPPLLPPPRGGTAPLVSVSSRWDSGCTGTAPGRVWNPPSRRWGGGSRCRLRATPTPTFWPSALFTSLVTASSFQHELWCRSRTWGPNTTADEEAPLALRVTRKRTENVEFLPNNTTCEGSYWIGT